MKTWIFSVIILPITVNGYVDEWNLIHFSKGEKELRDCLETQTDLSKILHKNVKDSDWESHIIERLSNFTHELTIPVENIDALAVNSVNILRSSLFKFDKDQQKQVKEAIKSALKNCSDPQRPSSNLSGDHDLPYFLQEIPELAVFFNLMLVPSGFYLRDHHSLFFMYAFAERALSLLLSALGKLNNDLHQLDRELLSMWNRRTRLFYDYNNPLNGYIHHFYRADRPRPYTASDPSLFTPRRLVPYNDRDRYNESNRDYENFKYYFEKVLFFGLEIANEGIIDPSDIHNNSLTYRDVSEYHVNRVWVSKTAFRRYLDLRQRRELIYNFARSSPIFSSLVQSLRIGDRIDGLHLALMFYLRLKSQRVKTETTTSRPAEGVPTLVLRAPPDVSFELPSTSSGLFGSCLPHWSRFTRDLRSGDDKSIDNNYFDDNLPDIFTLDTNDSNTMEKNMYETSVGGFDGSFENSLKDPLYQIFTYNTTGTNKLNRVIYEMLRKEQEKNPRNSTSLVNFVQNELKNSASTASEILKQACDRYYNSWYHYENARDEGNSEVYAHRRVQFSSDKTWIFQCMKHHRLFHCGEYYENTGIFKEIADLAVIKYSGKMKTGEEIGTEAKTLIHSLVNSYPSLPVDYVTEATKQALLFCSKDRILYSLKCPSYYFKNLGQMMLVWFDKSFRHEEDFKPID